MSATGDNVPSLRDCNYVDPPVNVRALAAMVGVKDIISIRELIKLLGPRQFGPMPLYVLGHSTNSLKEVWRALDGCEPAGGRRDDIRVRPQPTVC